MRKLLFLSFFCHDPALFLSLCSRPPISPLSFFSNPPVKISCMYKVLGQLEPLVRLSSLVPRAWVPVCQLGVWLLGPRIHQCNLWPWVAPVPVPFKNILCSLSCGSALDFSHPANPRGVWWVNSRCVRTCVRGASRAAPW